MSFFLIDLVVPSQTAFPRAYLIDLLAKSSSSLDIAASVLPLRRSFLKLGISLCVRRIVLSTATNSTCENRIPRQPRGPADHGKNDVPSGWERNSPFVAESIFIQRCGAKVCAA